MDIYELCQVTSTKNLALRDQNHDKDSFNSKSVLLIGGIDYQYLPRYDKKINTSKKILTDSAFLSKSLFNLEKEEDTFTLKLSDKGVSVKGNTYDAVLSHQYEGDSPIGTNVIIYKKYINLLDKENIKKIVELPILEVIERVKEMGYSLSIDETLKEFLVEKGYDEKYGARPLNRAIQKYVEDPISEKVLENLLNIGDNIVISYDSKIEDVKVDIKTPKVSKEKRR
jgi:hypothetical protein